MFTATPPTLLLCLGKGTLHCEPWKRPQQTKVSRGGLSVGIEMQEWLKRPSLAILVNRIVNLFHAYNGRFLLKHYKLFSIWFVNNWWRTGLFPSAGPSFSFCQDCLETIGGGCSSGALYFLSEPLPLSWRTSKSPEESHSIKNDPVESQNNPPQKYPKESPNLSENPNHKESIRIARNLQV